VLIASFPTGPWQTNTYVVATAPGTECVVIDPGLGAESGVGELVAEYKLRPVAVMVTHGHLDHMFSVAPLCRSHSAVCWVHPADRDLLSDPLPGMGAETRELLARLVPDYPGFVEPDEVRELVDSAVIDLAGMEFLAIHAPGHTPGCAALLLEGRRVLLTGDVVVTWNPLTGRTGPQVMPSAFNRDTPQALRSLDILYGVPADVLLPGHGEPWTEGAAEAARLARAAGPS